MPPPTLKACLVRMIGVAAVPFLLFSIGAGAWTARNTREAVEQRLENAAHALSLAVDREIGLWASALHALATSRHIATGDFEAFRQQAQEVSSRYEGWVVMNERDGRQVINTLLPPGEPLPRAGDPFVAEVFRTGRPAISDLFAGAETGRPILAASAPVYLEGNLRYTIQLGIAPERIARILRVQALPSPWSSAVIDGNGVVIAHADDGLRFVGTAAPAWYAEAASRADAGLLEGPFLDGASVRLAFRRLPDARWSAAVAMPKRAFAAAWLTPLFALTGAAIALLAAALVLATLHARRIARSVASLLAGAGDDPHPIREIEDVRALLRERERARERLAQAEGARASAVAANRGKDEFLAMLSHELRTPLSAILGWIAVIRSQGREADTLQRGLDVIERNAKQQARLIDDLLDLSRITSGRLHVERAPTDFSRAVQQAVDAARPAALERGVALHAALEPGVTVSGDPPRLVQIAGNLLTNAIKFTPRGGRVDVTLDRAGGLARLVVRDTGAGIAADELPHIFERYAQASTAGARARSGLGLGLAIVRHLTEQHGGQVTAASEGRGRGATFTVTIPALGTAVTGDR